MIIDTNKQKGNAGLSIAIAYFGTNNYTVSLPLNDTQWYDLIVEKDGVFKTVQVKFTASKNQEISLKSCGGTHGVTYDSVLEHPVDFIFCVNQDMKMWLIPMEDIKQAGNTKSFRLREHRSSYAYTGFDTSKYCVIF